MSSFWWEDGTAASSGGLLTSAYPQQECRMLSGHDSLRSHGYHRAASHTRWRCTGHRSFVLPWACHLLQEYFSDRVRNSWKKRLQPLYWSCWEICTRRFAAMCFSLWSCVRVAARTQLFFMSSACAGNTQNWDFVECLPYGILYAFVQKSQVQYTIYSASIVIL